MNSLENCRSTVELRSQIGFRRSDRRIWDNRALGIFMSFVSRGGAHMMSAGNEGGVFFPRMQKSAIILSSGMTPRTYGIG